MTNASADTTPTMVQVEELTDRAAALEQQAAQLAEHERDLSQQIAERHATGGNKGKGLDALTRQRRDVREQRADILEALPLLHDQIAKGRELACTADAVKRMTGIKRAFGSLRQELDDDEAKVQEAAAAYRDAVNRVNDRYKALALLKAEANALQDRFGVAAPMFPPVVIPAMRAGCAAAALVVDVKFLAHAHVSPATETCEHGLRTRRTYQEVANTPSGEILNAAGPKAWPELTAQQREMVEGRERERQAEAATATRFAGEAARGLQRRTL